MKGLIIKGTKYFKYDEEFDELDIIRIRNSKCDNAIKAFSETQNKKITITKDTLINDYTKLNPDGFIYFNIAKIRDLEDVLITVFTREDIEKGDERPYSVCRQNITDFFANSISPDMQYCGMNVTRDTLPVDVKMESILMCDTIESYEALAFYITDNLDTILSFVKTKEYDNILYTLLLDHVKYKFKDLGKKYYMDLIRNRNTIDGYCKGIKDLLIFNNFMYDLRTAFNIYSLDIDLSMDNEYGFLSTVNRQVIERILCKNIVSGSNGSLIIRYNKDIDIDEIKRDYILVSDLNENLYIVAYKKSNEKYHIPIETIESADNIKRIAESIDFSEQSSATEAYNHIRYNNDKYK